MINKKFESLFKHPARNPQDKLTQFHMDIAASIQEVLENCMLSLTRSIYDEYGIENLCLAYVAFNYVANGKILKIKNLKISGFNQLQEMQGSIRSCSRTVVQRV